MHYRHFYNLNINNSTKLQFSAKATERAKSPEAQIFFSVISY